MDELRLRMWHFMWILFICVATCQSTPARIHSTLRQGRVQQQANSIWGNLEPRGQIDIIQCPNSEYNKCNQQNQFNLQDKIDDDSNENSFNQWRTVTDPNLYVLTEVGSDAKIKDGLIGRDRRNSPSLSIVNPLDVLRQRLLLEISRRKMRQSHSQIMANAEILKNIGR